MTAEALARENQVYQAAVDCAAEGIPVFPIAAGTKLPHQLVPNGLLNATCARDVIDSWFDSDPGIDAFAAVPGAAGFVVVDIDAQHDGFELIHELEQRFGPLPPTRTTCKLREIITHANGKTRVEFSGTSAWHALRSCTPRIRGRRDQSPAGQRLPLGRTIAFDNCLSVTAAQVGGWCETGDRLLYLVARASLPGSARWRRPTPHSLPTSAEIPCQRPAWRHLWDTLLPSMLGGRSPISISP